MPMEGFHSSIFSIGSVSSSSCGLPLPAFMLFSKLYEKSSRKWKQLALEKSAWVKCKQVPDVNSN